MPVKVSFREAFRFWVKLGFISFGGPAGQIAIMQKELVENKKWIEQDDFLHALNFCMLLPGPEAQQLAAYMGWRLHGIKGGIVAGAFFVIPSIFFLLALSYIYAAYGNLPQIAAILDGFKAIVVAIVVEAVLKIAKKAFKNYLHVVISALSFIAIYFFRVPFPLIVFGAAILGIFLLKDKKQNSHREKEALSEETQRTNKHYLPKVFAAFFLLWLAPFLIVVTALGWNNIAVENYVFFSQAALVTFGGAYAVLAYVNQAVVGANWITAAQSVDGLALAETTPGPLIMVLQFIGFMTGWNNAGGYNQTSFAVLCALMATYATFLPSFFFIFVGAPYIERLRHNRNLASALSGVTASVVGVILNLALMFGATVVFHEGRTDFFALILAVLSFGALYFLKADVLLIVVLGGLCGLFKYLFFN
jgi:chromate transporter